MHPRLLLFVLITMIWTPKAPKTQRVSTGSYKYYHECIILVHLLMCFAAARRRAIHQIKLEKHECTHTRILLTNTNTSFLQIYTTDTLSWTHQMHVMLCVNLSMLSTHTEFEITKCVCMFCFFQPTMYFSFLLMCFLSRVILCSVPCYSKFLIFQLV